jgi:Tol biopolymer transport system component
MNAKLVPLWMGILGLASMANAQSAPPELFAPGEISTRENELNAVFSADGRTIYFTRKAGDGGRFAVILSSTLTAAGKWSEPRVAEFSGQFADYDPMLSPDGSQLFFISYRPLSGASPKRDLDIWVADRAGNGWGPARNLGAPVNGDGDELYPSIASDGSLYFSSCGRPDSRGRCDLYRSRRENGRYLTPENLGDSINTTASETDAYVAPDQSYIIFAAYGRSDAVGDGDLYITFQRNGGWSAPRNLGPRINTVAREYCPVVSPDGRFFYFTSQSGFTDAPRPTALTYPELRDALGGTRNGFGDIYRVPIKDILF